MPQKRNKDYYTKRLDTEHPELAKDVAEGKLDLWEALDSTGIKRKPKTLNGLKRAWKNATSSERKEFLRWLNTNHPQELTLPSKPSAPQSLVDDKGYLVPQVKDALVNLLKDDRFTTRDMAEACGLSTHDTSISRALFQGHRLKESIIEPLTAWLEKHR